MNNAKRWLDQHGFADATAFENEAGERLGDLLDKADGVAFEESMHPRWRFPDGSAIEVRSGTWWITDTHTIALGVPFPKRRRTPRARAWVRAAWPWFSP